MISIRARMIEQGYSVDSVSDGVAETLKLEVGGLASSARNEWIRLAQSRLKTSREIYVNGLQQAGSFKVTPRGDETVFEVELVGRMPNNFEFGMPSFDMKAVRPGWLGGGKAKTAADGSKYVVIPFRHSTNGTNARFGYTGKAAAVEPSLQGQLRATTKAYGLDRMIRTAAGQVVQGPVARVPKSAPVHPYLQGLTRMQKATSGTTADGQQRGQGTLMTWRVMSENSPADSWIHPGLEAAAILPEVERWVDSQVDQMLERLLR